MPITPGDWKNGEWRYFQEDGRFYVVEKRADGGGIVCDRVMREENARLIAAAPELLAFCEKLNGEDTGPMTGSEFWTLRLELRAALKKARGEP